MCRPKDTGLVHSQYDVAKSDSIHGCAPEQQIQLTHVPINQISVYSSKKEWVTSWHNNFVSSNVIWFYVKCEGGRVITDKKEIQYKLQQC